MGQAYFSFVILALSGILVSALILKFRTQYPSFCILILIFYYQTCTFFLRKVDNYIKTLPILQRNIQGSKDSVEIKNYGEITT